MPHPVSCDVALYHRDFPKPTPNNNTTTNTTTTQQPEPNTTATTTTTTPTTSTPPQSIATTPVRILLLPPEVATALDNLVHDSTIPFVEGSGTLVGAVSKYRAFSVQQVQFLLDFLHASPRKTDVAPVAWYAEVTQGHTPLHKDSDNEGWYTIHVLFSGTSPLHFSSSKTDMKVAFPHATLFSHTEPHKVSCWKGCRKHFSMSFEFE